MGEIVVVRRLTSAMLRAMPAGVERFDARLYAVVARRPAAVVPGRYGADARLDPCVLDWEAGTISVHIPLDVNPGISSWRDLDPDFFEAVQAAFVTLAFACG